MIECYLRTDAFITKQSLFPSRKILLFSQSRILVKNFFYSPVVPLLWNLLFKGLFPQQKRFVWGLSFPQRTCFMEISWLRIFMPSEELIYWKCSSKNSLFPSRVWSWLRIFHILQKDLLLWLLIPGFSCPQRACFHSPADLLYQNCHAKILISLTEAYFWGFSFP